MIQRIQTVYLALAVLLLVLCCCMPLAEFEPQGMGLPFVMYNLALLTGEGVAESYLPASLLLLVGITELVLISAIVGYRDRRKQMKTCGFAMFFELLWIAVYGVFALVLVPETTFHPCFSACLPVIALVLTWMAKRAIKKDDDLVRSADRIR